MIIGGYALFKGRSLSEGQHFGDIDVLLRSDRTRRPTAISVNHLHVMYIGPDEIEECVQGALRMVERGAIPSVCWHSRICWQAS